MSVCNRYISLNHNGSIDFKGKIKHNLNMRKFSKVEAAYIIYDLIYDIVNSKLNRFQEIEMYLFNLIKKVNDAHKQNSSLYKIFTHNYSFEVKFVENYLLEKQEYYGIEKIDLSLLYSNLPILKSKKENAIEIKPKIVSKTNPKKKSKFNLNHLNRNDLCFILNLNPELNFDKEKVLKKRLIREFSKISKNPKKLENLSKEEIRQFFEPIYELEIKKEKFKSLLNKAKKFNNQKFFDILDSKEEYLEIYSQISKYFKDCDNEVFKDFLSCHDFILDNSLNESDLFDDSIDLDEKYGDIFLNYKLREDMRKTLKNSNFYEIDEIPEFLKNKLFTEKPLLQNVSKLIDDLDEYTDLSVSDEDNLIRIHNENVLDTEINRNPQFFRDITDQAKKRAIVLDDKNVRIIAGAGTGKTFTIQKKVKYLIEKKDVSPEKILCLCYTNKGAKDLDYKVNSELDDAKVDVSTFHEFCRKVIRACGFNKTTNRYLLDNIIRNYIKFIVDKPEKLNKLTEYFGYYINPSLNDDNFDTFDEMMDYEQAKDLSSLKRKYYEAKANTVTLQGEIVKSIGELIISNYLFIHDIDYEYESYYGHSFADLIEERFLYSGNYFSMGKISSQWNNVYIIEAFIDYERRWERYRPDFYLPEYDIYLEHFGIGRKNNDKWLPKDYIEQMEDKRFRHKLYGTKLIETYYYYLAEGRLTEELESLLIENNVEIGQKNQEEILKIISTTNKVDDYNDFNNLIKTFINIFEAQYYPKNMFEVFKDRNKNEKYGYTRKRQDLFFDIISDIYEIYYESNMGEIIDHNREITNALELIQDKKYDKSYDYVLIDEYQDINYVRCKLLQEFQKNTDCNIFVVGDDWQSIYKFNGSDVNLFINFDKYFPHSETIKLVENRRNSQILNDITSEFILQNKNQEKKKLKYYRGEENPNLNPIKIVPYEVSNYFKETKRTKILKLHAIIQDILKNNIKNDLKILLLGRNNKDLEMFINNSLFKEMRDGKYKKVLYSQKTDLDITFMTIHQAKGLEYDEVVLLRVEDNEYGFPNQIKDDSVLSFVKSYEKYPYAEERRLFYVALTRTSNNVYLLVPVSNESVFIDELRDDFNIKNIHLPIDKSIKIYEESDFFQVFDYIETDIDCPNCDEGKVTLVINNQRGTKYFRCSEHAVPNPSHYSGGPYYGNVEDIKYVEKCPSCDGILIRHGNILKCCLNAAEGCMETKELKLDKKDLDYDE